MLLTCVDRFDLFAFAFIKYLLFKFDSRSVKPKPTIMRSMFHMIGSKNDVSHAKFWRPKPARCCFGAKKSSAVLAERKNAVGRYLTDLQSRETDGGLLGSHLEPCFWNQLFILNE
jgi:hypothetical protein